VASLGDPRANQCNYNGPPCRSGTTRCDYEFEVLSYSSLLRKPIKHSSKAPQQRTIKSNHETRCGKGACGRGTPSMGPHARERHG